MKKTISSLLIAAFFCTNIAHAEETVVLPPVETQQGEVDPGEAISPMKVNQKAPFSGVLVSPKAVATLTAKLASIADKIKLAHDEATEQAQEVCRNEKSVMKIQTDADKNILSARISNNERIITSYEKSLAQAQASQGDPALWIGLGALGGATVTVLTAFAIAQSIK